MFLRTVLLLIMLAGWQALSAQSYIGQRETINYEKKQYNAGTQNWKIKQDAQGRIYFANNEGVLVFDGANWQLYPLPNKTIVWSIEFGKDKRLYAGGQDEMGYYAPSKNGTLAFTSLKGLLPVADQKFSDVWDIVSLDDDVFFRTRNKIFRYHQKQISVYPSYSTWLFLGICKNQLVAHDEHKGIMVFKNGAWQTYIDKALLPAGFYITGIADFNKTSSLVTTAKNGNFILTGKQLQYWPLTGASVDNHQHFLNTIALSDSTYLISTYTNGIYQVDKTGRVMENISKKEGLQNSNVRCMYMDTNQNIWLGLDNGIDMVTYNNAVKHINPPAFKDGGGFSMTRYENSLYFALSNGIYELPIQNIPDLSYTNSNFKSIAEGLSWHLSVINNNLLAGRDDGIYKLTNDKLMPVATNTGYWLFEPLAGKPGPTLMAAGNYDGVRLFDETGANFADKGNIGSFNESARFLAVDEYNNIWTSHPYRGIYRLRLNQPKAKIYTQADGLPSTLNNFIFKLKNKVVVATEKGIYTYNNQTDKFEKNAAYTAVFGSKSLRYLREDQAGNIWFVEGKSMGVVDYSAAKPSIVYIPELNGRILSGFENVYPVNEQNIFVGSENGFYHINYTKYKKNIQPLSVYVRKVVAKAKTDSLLFGGYFSHVNDDKRQIETTIPKLSYLWNSLHFEYASPVFEAKANVTYSYYLEGFDKEWSEWSRKTEKDYTNLSAGKYTFMVKARNHQNNDSSVCSFSFTIFPPWYQTTWAYLAYFAGVVYLLYFFYKLQEKKHRHDREKQLLLQHQKNEEEQRQMAYAHRLELEIAEKEVVKLKNEKLETEIEYKNSELATTAMTLVQKKEFILKIKDELQRLQKSGKEAIETVEIKKILRLLSEEKKVNEEWEQFSAHFNKVHADFLTTLKERYPTINQQELKLSAYLIMNLSSKEIAQLMAISVRGVEISRYRLRKKLLIPTEVNLFEFLFEIQRDCIR